MPPAPYGQQHYPHHPYPPPYPPHAEHYPPTTVPSPPGTQPTRPYKPPTYDNKETTDTSSSTVSTSSVTTLTTTDHTLVTSDTVDDEQSLQDKQRLDELLNQIDKNRGVTVAQDEDMSVEEPNLFSEEQGEVEYDDQPPGDDVIHHDGEFSLSVQFVATPYLFDGYFIIFCSFCNVKKSY